MTRLYLAFSLLFFTSTTFAQPPGITGRWTGNTAIVPPQGYSQGDPLTLTWGFMDIGTGINDNVVLNGNSIPNAPNNLQTFLNGIYGNQGVWQPHFQSVFDRWSSISGLAYQFESEDDGIAFTNSNFPTGVLGLRADVRIGGKALDGNSGVLAYNYGPNAAEMVIDTNDNFFANNLANNSRALRNVVAHEHGHGLGMAHVDPIAGNHLMERFVNLNFDGPQLHDILVAQRAYGDAREKVMTLGVQGNDAFTQASSLGGPIGIGQAISVGNSPKVNMANNNTRVDFNAIDFVSIDDNSDTDFWSFTITSPGRITLLLEALGITYEAQAVGAGTFNFNIRNRSDMTLTLFDTNGTTQLLSVNNTGLGGDETLSFDLLAAGTYFARITGADNGDASSLDTQFYALTASLAAIPEPTTIALIGTLGVMGYGAWKRRRRLLRQQMDSNLSKV